MDKHPNNIDFDKLQEYIQQFIKKVGVKLAYSVLLLYYAYSAGDTPKWAKNIIVGSLAYFLSPIDGIPDLSPFLGFTDDLGVLSFGIVAIACYIDQPVRIKARTQLKKWFSKIDQEDIEEVDKLL